ncbi:flagellar protein FlaG [Pseudoalteromonas sp. SMS1]|uniref:flagellar protein FlaG n=1 Tax=Pseudoalteromonas sp. SMS1 TaxID=2908894 RepID=UPI001F3228A0|nr:flagellar protein FlaG [Pseudoalteromonas sp. SMS1]MCF2859359.1 flagellar protein FlaG [Pseudoalteromonas sp. SMS1]
MKEVQIPLGNGTQTSLLAREQSKQEEGVESLRAIEKLTDVQDKLKSELEQSDENSELFEAVKANLAKVNDFIPVTATNLSFEFDDQGDPPFIRVVDKDSDEVIREIPSEEFREVAKALDELADKVSGKGVLFDRTA